MMTTHDAAWFARQDAQCIAAILEAEKRHTQQELAEAEAFLAASSEDRQQRLPVEANK